MRISSTQSAIITLAAALVVVAVGLRGADAQTRPILGPVRFDLEKIADSGSYFLYSYRIVNPRSSRGGVASISLDISVPTGGRARLPFTGHLEHGAGEGNHAPIGAIAPDRWQMMTTSKGTLEWYTDEALVSVSDSGAVPASADSAAPGGSREGFGLRSPYLPGLRSFQARPTYQSCCMRPNDSGEYPIPSEFPVTGAAVVPTIDPHEMTLGVVASEFEESCGLLGWVDGEACAELRPNIRRATRGVAHDRNGAREALRAFLDNLNRNREAKRVTDNAYWLLRTNGEYVLAHL